MPDINITAMHVLSPGAPSIPTMHRAFMGEAMIGPRKLPCLKMSIGDCTLSVFPPDPKAIRRLIDDLTDVAVALEKGARR